MLRAFALALAALSLALAGDPAFSDPAKQAPAPRDAAGYPSRDAALDVLPGFLNPPAGYGEVAFYWWLGDPLTKERIAWQLDRLQGMGVAGLQVNYAHSDRGGLRWGLTYPGDPPLFSEPWWDLFGWYLKEARKRGMAVSLSDYTLGPGQGWHFDEILRENPGMRGAALQATIQACRGGRPCSFETPQAPLAIAAYRSRDGAVVPGSGIDLRKYAKGSKLDWRAPGGDWQVVAVYTVEKPFSLDPMHPLSGKKYIEKFFQPFEDRNPGQSGSGLNFFFSDELDFGIRGWLWTGDFAAEFRKRKGYDVARELPSLFVDTGPRTPKVRLDYSDVMVSLEEERFFRPVYEWHRSRGMLFGCDHGGRGKDVAEFGDYFRTQRWTTGPGNDQPGLASDVIKNKVASSIAHLYERPRTWLEGYHSSGWGTTTAQLTDATLRNFAMGQNLLTLHGLYYSTHGGWWEWAPPCNHFRMPYWAHMGEFLRMTERLSYLLSQGVHRADVAIVYPVAAVEAGMGGKESVAAAFSLGERLYERGIDFDFIDFESLARARVVDRRLEVSGEQYRVLVLPSMRAVRHSTIQKAFEFYRGGGVSIALGALPEASDRTGLNDRALRDMVREMFASVWSRAATPEQVEDRIRRAIPRDFACGAPDPAGRGPYVLHRSAGSRDIYFVYGAAKDSVCSFRTRGRVEAWNAWTGEITALQVVGQTQTGTKLRMPFEKTEPQIIVFAPGRPLIDRASNRLKPLRTIALAGPWEFELKPTLDNRFGDFRLPATQGMIGAEARKFLYLQDTEHKFETPLELGAAQPATVETCSYGPRFWKLGPLPGTDEAASFEAAIALAGRIDPLAPVIIGGRQHIWTPYEYSTAWGIEDDPGHQGYHGLKAEFSDDFIALGRRRNAATTTVYQPEEGGTRYLLWTSVAAAEAGVARVVSSGMKPARAWLNGAVVDTPAVRLNAGANALLLRYDGPGRGKFALAGGGPLVFDTRPEDPSPRGWYRFMSPPGLRAMTIVARGKVRAWVAGAETGITRGRERPDGSREYRSVVQAPAARSVPVAIQIEQERGSYGGAALPEPVALECGRGEIEAGDWSRIDGLSSYSGGAWYRKTISLPADAAEAQVTLNLGSVAATAEVHVNGHPAGIKAAPPWKVDITKLIAAGENRIEILVYNTLANHYRTIPTRYRGSPQSGLLGPVAIELR